MSDHTNNPWDALASRGTPRGADAVLSAAVAAAESRRDGVPVAEMSERPPRRARSRAHRTFGIVGIAALLGVGGYAIAGVQSNGTGADSPQAAVHQLADAIDHQDALAAVATLDPSEVSTLQSTVGSAEHKAKQTKLVDSSSSPFAGINLSVNGLQTTVTTLAPGIAKVTLSGSISAKLTAGELSEVLQRVEGNKQGSIDLARLGVHGGAPFVITVERDGKWYVSPAYTLFEDIRTDEDLPEADFGSTDPSKLGANTASDAVNQLVRAIGAGDWNTVTSLAPPDQFPLYEYRAAFAQLMQGTTKFEVAAVHTTPHVNGDAADVDTTANGTYSTADDTGKAVSEPWVLQGGCAGAQSYPGGFGFSEGFAWCVSDRGSFPFGFNDQPPAGPARVHAVEESGRWYVSPVGTALDYLDPWIGNFDENDLASLVQQPLLAPVSGRVDLDQAIDLGPIPQPFFFFPEFHHYTLTVDGSTDVVVDARTKDPSKTAEFSDLMYGVTVWDAGGKQLAPASDAITYHLPAKGTYDVVANVEHEVDETLTVWRAADAPKDVPKGDQGCGPTPDGGEECTSSGTETYTQNSDSSSSSKSATVTTVMVP